jgi:hypothetical protein
VAYLDATGRQRLKLRDVLKPARVGDRAGQRDVQLHQEMWTDGDVEGLREMRRFQPGRDSTNARDIHLNDRAGILLSGRFALRQRRSHNAVSTAASREGGDGADRGRMREKEKLFPELLDLGGVSSNGRAAPTAAPL